MSKISLKHSGGNVVSLNSPTSAPTSADVAFKLPNADGNASEALITDGSGNLSFASVAGGKILQVISSNKLTVQSTTSTSYVDVTDMAATITPSASTSKVLILITMVIQKSDYTFFARLLRDSTEIGSPTPANSALSVYNSNNQNMNEGRTHVYLDSPNTTNAVTYKLQMKSDGSAQINFNAHSAGTLTEYISQSSFTVFEVAA